MPGGVLILFVSGAIGAMALGVWIALRRNNSRSPFNPAATHSAKLTSDPPVGTAVRGSFDDRAESEKTSSVEAKPEELDSRNGDKYLAPSPTPGMAIAAQPPEMRTEDAPTLATPCGDDVTHATGLVSTAEAATGSAEIPHSFEPENEAATVCEPDHALLSEEEQKESLGLATVEADYSQAMPAPNESAGVAAPAKEGLESCLPIFSSPREDVRLAEDDCDLTDATDDASSSAPSDGFASLDASNTALGQDDRQNERSFAEKPPSSHGVVVTEQLPEIAPVTDDLSIESIESDLTALPGAVSEQSSELAEAVPHTKQGSATRLRPSKPAQYRDRRGQRRPVQSKMPLGPSEAVSPPIAVLRTPAEARLRLIIHPVRRTVSVSAVLARPAGYPDSITLFLGAETEIGAYGEDRYDDADLEWTPNLFSEEVRLDSREGYQWLRSSRRIHIFSEQADEQGLMSVGSAILNSSSAIVCTQEDAAAVRLTAAACGSPELVSHDHWSGVPPGWAVLSGYRPARAAPTPLDPHLTTLDPNIRAEIRLSGGLQVRAGYFAQGSPPRIDIEPFPAGAQVTIDGMPAVMNSDGSWWATGWDGPGDHLVDVAPGPSLTYRIVGDPWAEGGWESWDAHPGRFPAPNDAPWARAQICGASVSGPFGEHVVATEPMSSVIAVGLLHGVAVLHARPDAPVSVGLLRETPAFLISSSGPRRIQGRVDWLVPAAGKYLSRIIDPSWVAVVRGAASRRLPLISDSSVAQEAWRRVSARAHRYRKAGA